MKRRDQYRGIIKWLVIAAMRAGVRLPAQGEDPSRAAARDSIQVVDSGEAILSADIATRLMDNITSMHQAPPLFSELTDREHEIIALIAQEPTNAQIMARLVLIPKTLRNHISNILSKLQVADHAEAILRVI